MGRITRVAIWTGSVLVCAIAIAGTFTRDNYFDYVGPMPRLVEQSPASERFRLYGDREEPGYRDADRNGVDDRRQEHLLAIAELFSPILRRNNHSVPRDFESVLRLRFDESPLRNVDDFRRFYEAEPVLCVDVWDDTGPAGARIRSEDVNLSLAASHAPDCESTGDCGDPDAHFHDDTLRRLLEGTFESANASLTSPRRENPRVLFFDFPGENERTWRRIYKALEERDRYDNGGLESRIYAHPFIVESPDAKGERRYEFVLQYWLFYPFNDGSNNHEGDWEHLNVRITTVQARGDPLTEGEIRLLLDPDATDALPSLVIRKVDYYFHSYVMVVDYAIPGVNFLEPDRQTFLDELSRVEHRRTLQRWGYERVHERIHLFPGAVNTHPIGFIGGDNMGFDQILTLPGGKNRNSHGTYPFTGIWRVGSIGNAEKITSDRDYRFPLPPLATNNAATAGPTRKTRYRNEPNDHWLIYGREDLILVPDWERVRDLVLTEPEARRRWSWLILPIRWGFPASDSPIGGRLRFTDLGQNSPVGPAYHGAWNRVGAASDFELYVPHILTAQSKVGLSDNFRGSWGCMNLTIPTLISLPAANVFWTVTGARFENMVKLFPKTDAPFRYYSIAVSPVTYSPGNDLFAGLLPGGDDPAVESYLLKTGGRIDEASLDNEPYPLAQSPRSFSLMFNQHIGTLTSENALTLSNSRVAYRFDDHDAGATVRGDLALWELQGSIRWNLVSGRFQPFVRAGYGWSWYRVANNVLSLPDSESKPLKTTRWYHAPSLRHPRAVQF